MGRFVRLSRLIKRGVDIRIKTKATLFEWLLFCLRSVLLLDNYAEADVVAGLPSEV